jgi:hypothetical protein
MPKKGKDTGSDRVGMFNQVCLGRGSSPGVDVLLGVSCEEKTIYLLSPAKSKWRVFNLIEKPKSK